MTEPRRLLDDPSVSSVDRALLGAIASDGPSARARAAAASALGLGVGAGLAATSGTASAAPLAKATLWMTVAKAAVAVAGVGAVVTAAALQPYRASEKEPPQAAASASARTSAAPPRVLSAAPVESAAPSASQTPPASPAPPPLPVPPALVAAASSPRGPTATDSLAPPPSTLAAETVLVDRARATLASGDPGGALDDLRAYARAYPDGVLQREALVLDVDARLALGDTAAMRRSAEAYLSRYPSSPAAPRLRRLLEPQQAPEEK